MLRLNIGRQPEPSSVFAVTDRPTAKSWAPLEGNPWATGPAEEKGAKGQGGSGSSWSPLDFDPWSLDAITGPAPKPQPAPPALNRPQPGQSPVEMEPSAVYRPDPEPYFDGLFGQGAQRLEPTTAPKPPPDPTINYPVTNDPQVRTAENALRELHGLPPAETDRSWAERAADTLNATPIGTGRVRDLDPRGPGAQAALRGQVEATPYRAAAGDGSQAGPAVPGTVAYDPQSGDQFGGHASNMALAKASLIPLTSQENLSKRIMIYAQDLGVPPDRFFLGPDGQFKYVDRSGQVFAVAPTIGGGNLTQAPLDMARRVMTQGANNAGPLGTMAVAGAAGMVTGPENYGPTAMIMAGAGGALGDLAAQAAGNEFAAQSGYRPSVAPTSGQSDINWGHVLGSGLENAGYEAFARITPALLHMMGPRLFGGNPFRLTGVMAQDLARILEDDLKNGGTILKRAQVAQELGLPLTPADLLQVTRGVGGNSSDMFAMRTRLYNVLAQKENTLATLGGKRGAKAEQLMREYYVHRARDLFPNAVGKVVDRISPVDSPTLGFEMFKHAADNLLVGLERSRLQAGHQAGWGSLFTSPVMANPVPVIREVEQRLEHAAGPIRKELEAIRGELTTSGHYTQGGTTVQRMDPVTDYQRLHQVRLGLERRIDELKVPGSGSAEKTEILNELEGIRDTLRHQLNQHPLYRTGDMAFQQAGGAITDARNGVLQLLRRDPKIQERLGGPLADSGPTTIRAARELFEQAGLGAAWDAHVRAYLETHLRGAGQGYQVGLNFANGVASQPKLHAGLMEMVRDPKTRDLLEGLIDSGFAMDQRAKGLERFADQAVKPNAKVLNPNGSQVIDKATGLLTPIRSLAERGRSMQEWVDTKGIHDQAFQVTQPAMKNYKEMTDTVVPLGGHRGELFERGLFAAAPAIESATDLIPRVSPLWLAHQLGRLLPPLERDPSAPDLKIPRRGLLSLLPE